MSADTSADPGLEERQLSISWSRLRDWTECTERAHLMSMRKRSPVADIRNYFHGNVVDKCMRTWLDSPDPQPGQMTLMVDGMFDQVAAEAKEAGEGGVTWRHPGDKAELRVWCRELVTRLEPILYQVAIPYDYQPAVRFKKVPLAVPYLDGTTQRIWLNGELDLLVRDGASRLHVWDLKGTADEQYWRKVTGQLVFYGIAVKIMCGDWPLEAGLIQPMCKEQTLRFTFTPEHYREMLIRITRMAESMWRGDHAPKATAAGCDRCVVKHACPRWQVTGHRAPIGGR